ncbi:MAG: restriction endonuclease subunit S [Candidatus Jorgensenbacteria bacterium]
MTYPTKKLGEVCEVKKGKKPKLFDTQTATKLPYLEAKFMRGTKEAKFAEKDDKNSVPVHTNDLIIICDGSKSGDVFSGFEGILSSTMGRVDFSERQVEKKYLESFLKLNFGLFNSSKKGAAIPHLDFTIFDELEIPLPPLSEQEKIVAKLERVLAKISEAKKLRAEARENADNLLPAELHKIFDESRNKGWEEIKLGEVIKLQGGFAFKSTEYKTSGIPLVRIKNLQNEEINFRNAVFIDELERDKFKNFLLEENDILIAMSGATTGKLARVSTNKLPAFLNQRVGRFVIKDNTKTNVGFLWHFLKSLQDFVLLAAYGGAQPNISPSKIEAIKISLPPLAEQKKIVARLDSLSQKIQAVQKLQNTTAADFFDLQQSTLAKAFAGGCGTL